MLPLLIENTLFGEVNKIQIAISRLQAFEPKQGYHLCFSGGKDSLCIYYLALDADVKFTAYYNHTTVDPPELVYFIRKNYPNIETVMPQKNMWELIIQHKIPPTRKIRYCCEALKEGNPKGVTIVTGVRWAESVRRKRDRGMVEIDTGQRKRIILNNDNEEIRKMVEMCVIKSQNVVNPIIDWTNEDVWEYIKLKNLKYCSLYDKGYSRLGCIGCPLAGSRKMKWEFANYPKYYQQYLRTFDKMVIARKETGLSTLWENGQHVMDWWLGDKIITGSDNKQLTLDNLIYES